MTLSHDVIGNGLFALAAALAAIAYQYWQYRRQLVKSHKEIIAAEKKQVIEALISYRFVLLGDRRNDPLSTMHFNAALSAIPVHFSESKECMDRYRSTGDGFTPEKFYNLIIALMQDVPLGTSAIDKHLLENVPSVTAKTAT
ncbi:MAG: hypothetical protein H0U98_12710 [Alphaproteobacteria bacterium]|nr:hypothetical protein [Alphaproteobacteria bacterium]